ncbi:MAG: tetratricopeptide repeat protein [Chitinophagaceae bacterium]|nr:tetratricopeptide repeat protein [Chitinophagaceae bacterium]
MKKIILLAAYTLASCFYIYAQTEDKEFAVADSLVNAGEYQKAISLFNTLISNYGEKERFLTGRGFAYVQTNDIVRSRKDYNQALVINPSCSKCILNLAMLDVLERNVSSAFSLIEKYIKLEPAEGLGYAKRGELKFQTGQFDGAITDLNKSLELGNKSFYVYFYLAMAQMYKGNNSEALKAINEAFKLEPDAELAYFIRGRIYVQMGDPQSALKDLFACLQKNPKASEYHTYAGIALYNLNDYGKAMQAFNESLRLDSTDHVPYQYRSYLLYSQASFTRACKDKEKAYSLAYARGDENALKQIQQEFIEYCDLSKASGHYHSGAILFGQGDFDKAKQAYNNGLRLFPDDPLLLEGRGNTGIATGQFSEAMGFYHQSLLHIKNINPDLLTKETSAEKKKAAADFFVVQLYDNISFASMNLLKIDSALFYEGKAIDILKNNAAISRRDNILSQALVKRATIYIVQDNRASAAADISEALKYDPTNSSAYMERARGLILKNTIEGNIKDEKIASVFQPNDTKKPASFEYATTPIKNWDQKEVEAALEDLNKAIGYAPQNRDAYMLRAQAKILLKKNDPCPDILQAKKLGIADAAQQLNTACN